MILFFDKSFKKNYKKLHRKQQQQVDERLVLFKQYPFDKTLNNHQLKGKYSQYRSINISGDLRALFEIVGENAAYFVLLNTHSNLYK